MEPKFALDEGYLYLLSHCPKEGSNIVKINFRNRL